jgi:hypothetical protein
MRVLLPVVLCAGRALSGSISAYGGAAGSGISAGRCRIFPRRAAIDFSRASAVILAEISEDVGDGDGDGVGVGVGGGGGGGGGGDFDGVGGAALRPTPAF